MTFKPRVWFPIAVVATIANVIAVAFAAAESGGEVHAMVHAAVAVGFAVWAQRLWHRRRRTELPGPTEAIEALEIEVSEMRSQLSEAQERLDFTERLMARNAEVLRNDQQREPHN